MGWEVIVSSLGVAIVIIIGAVKIYKKVRKAGEDGVYSKDEIDDIFDEVKDTVEDVKEETKK